LRTPPITSGNDVVGAATIAPLGVNVSARNTSALRRSTARNSPP